MSDLTFAPPIEPAIPSEAYSRLAKFIVGGGVSTMGTATLEGQRKCYCRLSRKLPNGEYKTAIQYGDESEATLSAALDEVLT